MTQPNNKRPGGSSADTILAPGGRMLAVAGPAWAWQPWQEPCRYWEAEVCGGRLLYPAETVSLNPFPQDGNWRGGTNWDSLAELVRILLCHGGASVGGSVSAPSKFPVPTIMTQSSKPIRGILADTMLSKNDRNVAFVDWCGTRCRTHQSSPNPADAARIANTESTKPTIS